LTEYQTLKLEYKLNYKTNTTTNNLSILLSKYLKLNTKESFEFIKESISNTKNPIELLKIIKVK